MRSCKANIGLLDINGGQHISGDFKQTVRSRQRQARDLYCAERPAIHPHARVIPSSIIVENILILFFKSRDVNAIEYSSVRQVTVNLFICIFQNIRKFPRVLGTFSGNMIISTYFLH